MAIQSEVIQTPVYKQKMIGKVFLFTFVTFFVLLSLLVITSEARGSLMDIVQFAFWPSLIITVLFYLLFPIVFTPLIPKLKTKVRMSLEKYIGSKPEYLNTSISRRKDQNGISFSGSAIALKDDIIYIVDHGVVAKIPWDSIREWSWKIPGHSEFFSTGVSGGIQANIANVNSKAEAYPKSGFFVDVMDIDKPTWQYMCDEESVLKRWHEIFTQLNEKQDIHTH